MEADENRSAAPGRRSHRNAERAQRKRSNELPATGQRRGEGLFGFVLVGTTTVKVDGRGQGVIVDDEATQQP